MPILLPGAAPDAPVTAAQFSLLAQIIVRGGEYCYVRTPIADDVRALVRRGYLLFSAHNGKMILKPTVPGRLMVARGHAVG